MVPRPGTEVDRRSRYRPVEKHAQRDHDKYPFDVGDKNVHAER